MVVAMSISPGLQCIIHRFPPESQIRKWYSSTVRLPLAKAPESSYLKAA